MAACSRALGLAPAGHLELRVDRYLQILQCMARVHVLAQA